ncbi:MAG: hypothetical protein ABI600_05260 [Luteolibacter sp.]
MQIPQNLVTINPYFKAHAGCLAEFHALMQEFVEKTRSEKGCYFYEFTILDDRAFCREGYEGAAGVFTHLENVGELLGRMEKLADLTQLQFHGPAVELDKLREPLAHLPAEFFVLHCSVGR